MRVRWSKCDERRSVKLLRDSARRLLIPPAFRILQLVSRVLHGPTAGALERKQ